MTTLYTIALLAGWLAAPPALSFPFALHPVPASYVSTRPMCWAAGGVPVRGLPAYDDYIRPGVLGFSGGRPLAAAVHVSRAGPCRQRDASAPNGRKDSPVLPQPASITLLVYSKHRTAMPGGRAIHIGLACCVQKGGPSGALGERRGGRATRTALPRSCAHG